MSTTDTSSTVPSQQSQQGEKATTPSIIRIKPKDWQGEHEAFDPLDEDNWQAWRDDILLTFEICGLEGYVEGTLKCPDAAVDAVGADNWKYNDKYVRKIIRERLSPGQKYHTSNCQTAREMWRNLQAIHQPRGDQTENQLMRELTDMKAKDGAK